MALTALLVAIAACSDDPDDGAPSSTSSPPQTSSESEDTGTVDGTDPGPATPGDPATTLPAAAESVVLRGDGLGVAELGDEPAAVVEAMTEALGEPTSDSGWVSAFSEYGTCPGEQIRAVSWDELTLLFTDGETPHGRGEHLFSWRLAGAPPALGTETGFGWGATAADAEELHPGQVEQVPAEEPFPGFLVVEVGGGPVTAFLDEMDVVTNLEAGAPCGE